MYFGRSQINLTTIKHLLLDNHLDCKTQLECGLVFDISGCNCCGLLYGINLYNDIDHIQRSVLRNIKLFKTNMKPSCWLISPFQYIRKLCHWFLGKCCIQSLPLLNVLDKLLYTIFTMVHLRGSGAFPCANALYTHQPNSAYYTILPFCLAFIGFIFSLQCSSTCFKIPSDSAYSINETLN